MKKLLICAAFLGLFSISANASTYTSSGTCSTTDLSPAANECFGSVLPVPVNDSNIDLNGSTFGGETGIFGITDWSEIGKIDVNAEANTTTPSPATTSLSVSGTEIIPVPDPGDPTHDWSEGTWSINPSELSSSATIMVVLKAGNTFSAYLYATQPLTTLGDWATTALAGKDLSHFAIYGSQTLQNCGPNGCSNIPPPIPLPAPVLLLLTGLASLGFGSWRIKVKNGAA